METAETLSLSPYTSPEPTIWPKYFTRGFTKLTLFKFGLELVIPQNKPQMIFMLMFSGTEHKYIIQVHKHKVINVLLHDTIHQPLEG